uniref:Uncharacterized protein n=1 Tax=uncultured Bacillota bacterium TaxID=344338 RepID=A0A650EML2_9FIRM|nr:hypothetical protein Firmicute1046_0660 [uncultured Firmicutes bacterium]
MQKDFEEIKKKMSDLFRQEKVDYKEVYKLKLELDEWIEKYYFDNI